MDLIKVPRNAGGGPHYYIIDHSCQKVIKIHRDGQVSIAAAFEHTFQKYMTEFKHPKYESATYLEILAVTGWSEQRIQDFIGGFRTSQYCEGTIWPADFEEREDGDVSTGLWDPDTESPWL